MNIIAIIIGSALIAIALVIFVINIIRTPTNLRGFYGAMFFALLLVAIVGGVALLLAGAFQLIK